VQPTREEFLHIEGPAKALFYLLILGSCAYATWAFVGRAKYWRSGKPIDWRPDIPGNIVKFILAQRKVMNARPKSGAPMHLFIFYGFISLIVATTLLAINTYSPWKFHQGNYYLGFEAIFDFLGLFLVVGVGWALIRRGAFRPRVVMTDWRDFWALGLLLLLGLTGYVLEAARIKVNPQPWDSWSWMGSTVASLLPPMGAGGYAGIWWFHAVLVAVFICGLPHMRLKHIVMAVASAAGTPDRPMGTLQPIRMEEVEQTGKIGVEVPSEYSRWHLMSLDACMECGRCTEVCPANNAGKTLNPRAVVQDVHRAITINAAVAPTVTEESLWACTTCNACVEVCPVNIRHVDLIVDARRYLVAEGKLSGAAATVLRQTGSTSNAWGAQASSREDWMKGMDVPLARDKNSFDILFWVGCAGATDPGAIKTTKAIAELLTKAGVDFACLGQEEACTGDPARRIGDEFLFQEMASQNVGTFGKYKFKRIVTACPHCLNTFKNEYSQFDGNYEVVHHSQLLAELIAAGKLKAVNPLKGDVTYHDPCYLARVNDESDAPRSVLGESTKLNGGAPLLIQTISDRPGSRAIAEPEHHGRKTLCCGAGGGRMWMEEDINQRPGVRRAEELLSTGAKTVAVGCPFCRIMLDASIKQVTDESINLVDLAEMLRDANA
jgi:Fe-S oxidoreductase